MTVLRPATGRGALPAIGSRRVTAALQEQQRRLQSVARRLGSARAADVHDARVAARRSRSILATFRPLFDEEGARRTRRRLRRFARTLSSAREADVRRELIGSMLRADPLIDPADAVRCRALLRESQAAARDSLRIEVARPGWQALVDELAHADAAEDLVTTLDANAALLLSLVDGPWREAERLLDRGNKSEADLHELRLALKHCRYAFEVVAPLMTRSPERTLRRLRAAQDRLGEHRDVVDAQRWVHANEALLGSRLAGRLTNALRVRERRLGRAAAGRAAKALPAYAAWRNVTRSPAVRSERTPGRA